MLRSKDSFRSQIELTFYFETQSNLPIAGVTPEIDLQDFDSDHNFISDCDSSDELGFARCRVSSTRAGDKTVVMLSPIARVFSDPIHFHHGVATEVRISGVSSSVSADQGFAGTIELEIQDEFGNRVSTGPDSEATLTVNAFDSGDVLDGVLVAQAQGGVAQFSGIFYRTAGTSKKLRLNKSNHAGEESSLSLHLGSLTYEWRIAGTGVIESISDPFQVTAGPLHTLEVEGIPNSVVAGSNLSPRVIARDAYSNIVEHALDEIEVISSDSAADLPESNAFLWLSTLKHEFQNGVTLRTSGTRTVTFTHPETGIQVVSGSITVTPGEPSVSQSLISMDRTSALANGVDAISVSLVLKDAYGNTVPGANMSVTSSRGGSDILSSASVTMDSSGAGGFEIRSSTAGSSQIQLAMNGIPFFPVTNFSFNPAAPEELLLSILPPSAPSVVADGDSEVVVRAFARDSLGNGVPGTSVSLQIPPNGGQVVGSNPAITGANGSATFVLRSSTLASSYSFTATSGSITSNSLAIQFTPGPLSQWGLSSSLPSTVQAGEGLTLTLEAQDAFGNRVSHYTGTVGWSSTDHQATLPANYTFTATDAGLKTFSSAFALKTVGSRTITVTDSAANVSRTSTSVVVQPATVSQSSSVLSSAVSGLVADSIEQTSLSILLKDSFGNPLSGKTVTLSSSRGAHD